MKKSANFNSLSLTIKILLCFVVSISFLSHSELVFSSEEDSANVIIVVSQKRAQDEITVPISISTLNQEDLQFSGAVDLNDLSQQASNFSSSGQEGHQAAIYMRGVGTWSRNIGFDTRVGVYLDGIYLGQSSSLNQAMMGLQQAEILRGPQGTLFGKNTIAGAVNLITIKPDSSNQSGRIGVEVGNDGLLQYSGRFNLPLSNKTAIQASYMDHTFDGQYTNVFENKNEVVGGQNSTAFRIQLSHEINDYLDLYFSYDDSIVEGSWINGEALSDTFGVSTIEASLPESQDFIINTNHTPQNNYDNHGYNLTLSYTTENGSTLRSIFGYRDSSTHYESDSDYSALDFLHVEYNDAYSIYSQEFQWISASDDQFEYLGGLYFYAQKGNTNRNAIPSEDIVILNDLRGLDCILEVDITNPASWCLEPDKAVFNRGTIDANSWAAYGNLSYQLFNSTHLDFGLRFTSEEKNADYQLGTDAGGVTGLLFNIGSGLVDELYKDDFLSHSLGLRSQLDNTNIYAKWSTGFKSGGFNLDYVNQIVLDSGAGFNKETVNSFEIGLKGRYLNNHLKLAFAIFKSDYKDYQVSQFKQLGDNTSTITIENADEVNTHGLELSANYRLSESFTVNLNYGYLDAVFGSFEGGGQNNGDATGNPLPYAPEHSISSHLQYETNINVFGGTVFIGRLEYNYESDQQATTWNVSEVTLRDSVSIVPFSQLKAHSLINFRLGLVQSEGDWDAYLWSKNITDKRYLSRSFRSFFNTYTEQYADKRSYGLEFNYYY